MTLLPLLDGSKHKPPLNTFMRHKPFIQNTLFAGIVLEALIRAPSAFAGFVNKDTEVAKPNTTALAAKEELPHHAIPLQTTTGSSNQRIALFGHSDGGFSKKEKKVFENGPIPLVIESRLGLAKEIPLRDALMQIVPKGWSGEATQGVDVQAIVSWVGKNRQWISVLEEVFENLPYFVEIDWAKQKIIVLKEKPDPTTTANNVTQTKSEKPGGENAPKLTPNTSAKIDVKQIPAKKWRLKKSDKTVRAALKRWAMDNSNESGKKWEINWSGADSPIWAEIEVSAGALPDAVQALIDEGNKRFIPLTGMFCIENRSIEIHRVSIEAFEEEQSQPTTNIQIPEGCQNFSDLRGGRASIDQLPIEINFTEGNALATEIENKLESMGWWLYWKDVPGDYQIQKSYLIQGNNLETALENALNPYGLTAKIWEGNWTVQVIPEEGAMGVRN